MKFSVCIPNYNYARFVVPAINSALEQKADLEVCIRDNASTDNSVEVLKALKDKRVKVEVNACNVGFAGNLDRTVKMSSGEIVILLCADDLFRPGYLATLEKLHRHVGPERSKGIVISTTNEMIDPEDKKIGSWDPQRHIWHEGDLDAELGKVAGGPVYRVQADELLKRCLRSMTNPFNMSTTAYPRGLYEKIEGYGGGRLMNPDKWFHWRLMGVAQECWFIDLPLGASRWHPNNQTAQQVSSGALKFLVDDYVSSFEFDAKVLQRIGMDRVELEKQYVEYDIARHGLATLAGGDRAKARRIATFGSATYPQHAARNSKLWALKALLAAGRLGSWVAKTAYQARQWR